MLRRIPLLLLVSLAVALIAAGCGDDDDEPTTTETTEAATGATGAESEFAQQANEICREGTDELDAAAQEQFGGFDTWINNAAVSMYGRLLDVPIEDERQLFETNYWGVVNGSLAALPHLRSGGVWRLSLRGQEPHLEVHVALPDTGETGSEPLIRSFLELAVDVK
jgi:NAD(P)-dependent dehydrogenase (short-subunit alcohol dehydrogenase family)